MAKSMADIIREFDKSCQQARHFYNTCSERQRKYLDNLKELWQAGEIGATFTVHYDYAREKMGIKVGKDAFRKFLGPRRVE